MQAHTINMIAIAKTFLWLLYCENKIETLMCMDHVKQIKPPMIVVRSLTEPPRSPPTPPPPPPNCNAQSHHINYVMFSVGFRTPVKLLLFGAYVRYPFQGSVTERDEFDPIAKVQGLK